MIVVTNSDILGKNIRHLREQNRMTREDLAERIGWNPSDLQKMEEGSLFDIDGQVLIKVCQFFDVEMDSFMSQEITK